MREGKKIRIRKLLNGEWACMRGTRVEKRTDEASARDWLTSNGGSEVQQSLGWKGRRRTRKSENAEA